MSASSETNARETKKEASRPLDGKKEVPPDSSAPTSIPWRGAVTGLPGRHVRLSLFGTGGQGPVIVAPPGAPGAGEQLQTKTPHVPSWASGQLAPGPGSHQEPGQLPPYLFLATYTCCTRRPPLFFLIT